MESLMLKKYIAERKWVKYILLMNITERLRCLNKIYANTIKDNDIVVNFVKRCIREYNLERNRLKLIDPTTGMQVKGKTLREITSGCYLNGLEVPGIDLNA